MKGLARYPAWAELLSGLSGSATLTVAATGVFAAAGISPIARFGPGGRGTGRCRRRRGGRSSGTLTLFVVVVVAVAVAWAAGRGLVAAGRGLGGAVILFVAIPVFLGTATAGIFGSTVAAIRLPGVAGLVGHCRDFAAVVLRVALAGAITVMAFSAALDMTFSEAIAMGPVIAAVMRSTAMRGFFAAAAAAAAIAAAAAAATATAAAATAAARAFAATGAFAGPFSPAMSTIRRRRRRIRELPGRVGLSQRRARRLAGGGRAVDRVGARDILTRHTALPDRGQCADDKHGLCTGEGRERTGHGTIGTENVELECRRNGSEERRGDPRAARSGGDRTGFRLGRRWRDRYVAVLRSPSAVQGEVRRRGGDRRGQCEGSERCPGLVAISAAGR